MTREIVLPIKCSTVKRIDAALDKIVDIELHCTFIAAVLWSASTIYRIMVAPASWYPDYGGAIGLGTLSAVIICAWVCWLINDGINYILPYIPTITCIKDEES